MTYETIKKFIRGRKLPLSIENEDGEKGFISIGSNGEYKLIYKQDNGYYRIMCYWQDGSTEEIYQAAL